MSPPPKDPPSSKKIASASQFGKSALGKSCMTKSKRMAALEKDTSSKKSMKKSPINIAKSSIPTSVGSSTRSPSPAPDKAASTRITTASGRQCSVRKELSSIEGTYEKVTPRARNAATDTSWVCDEDEDEMLPAGRRWWGKKGKPQQKSFMGRVLSGFGLIVLIILVLLGVGFWQLISYYYSKPETEESTTASISGGRHSWKTKTSACRAVEQYSKWAGCIYETYNDEACAGDNICVLDLWEVSVDVRGIAKVARNRTTFGLTANSTENAACHKKGRKLCQDGRCVAVATNATWLDDDEADTAMHKKDLGATMDCLLIADAGAQKLVDRLKHLAVSKCDQSICANSAVEHALQIEFYDCDLNLDRSIRPRCPRDVEQLNAIRVITCDDCPNYAEADENAEKRQIERFRCSDGAAERRDLQGCHVFCPDDPTQKVIAPDGLQCSGGGTAVGFCIEGHCFPKTKEETKEDTTDEDDKGGD